MNEPAVVLRNRHETAHHWLGVELVGKPYRDAVGARLELQLADGEKLVRAVKGGGSYMSSGDRRVLFGLGPRDKIDRLTVRWPSGKSQTWTGLAPDRYWKLTEGEEKPEGK
jgi:enediyne biosynthesis protein E4